MPLLHFVIHCDEVLTIIRAPPLVTGYVKLYMDYRGINDVNVNFFTSLLYKTNRFYFAARLFNNRSRK